MLKKKGWKEDTHRWQLGHASHLDNLGSIWGDIISIFAKISKPTPPLSLPPRLPPTPTPSPPPQDHLAWSEWVSRGVNPRLRACPGTHRDLTFVRDLAYVLLSNSRSCPWSCPRCCPCLCPRCCPCSCRRCCPCVRRSHLDHCSSSSPPRSFPSKVIVGGTLASP